jgi:hypothetical protein
VLARLSAVHARFFRTDAAVPIRIVNSDISTLLIGMTILNYCCSASAVSRIRASVS